MVELGWAWLGLVGLGWAVRHGGPAVGWADLAGDCTNLDAASRAHERPIVPGTPAGRGRERAAQHGLTFNGPSQWGRWCPCGAEPAAAPPAAAAAPPAPATTTRRSSCDGPAGGRGPEDGRERGVVVDALLALQPNLRFHKVPRPTKVHHQGWQVKPNCAKPFRTVPKHRLCGLQGGRRSSWWRWTRC